ncbi:hypothetical protein Tco_0861472 [Tanacetum coccineum]|uniref:Uncharacterized protein n=1 Tax=Tanacetum coccineum TaxID=301880 RepID=A0ABQ5BHX5_9ASTR
MQVDYAVRASLSVAYSMTSFGVASECHKDLCRRTILRLDFALQSVTNLCHSVGLFQKLPFSNGMFVSPIDRVWRILETMVDSSLLVFGVNVSLDSGFPLNVISQGANIGGRYLLPASMIAL